MAKNAQIPRAHYASRGRLWRFAAIVFAFAFVLTVVEAYAKPDHRLATLATGLFPLVGAPIGWFACPRLSPRMSYQVGRAFLLLSLLSALVSMFNWRGTPVASAMGFHMVLVVVFTASFFRRRDVVAVLLVGGMGSLAVLVVDGPQLTDLLVWLPMMFATTGAGIVLVAFTEAAEALSYGDALTGVMNRRGWEMNFVEAVERSRRSEHPMSVLLIDLDWFKQVNDRFGHSGGDEVLRDAVTSWHGILRGGDSVARLGGDEFAVLLERADAGEAVAIGERLSESVHAATGVTCSVGVATLIRGGDATQLVAAADAQLYAAKHAGRARVMATEVGRSGAQAPVSA